jgi:MFS family permease
MIHDKSANLLLGTTLGGALGVSMFVAFLLLITFTGWYVYEKSTRWETKAYLITFACICVALILASTLSLREIYEPRSSMEMARSVWRSEYLWRSLSLSSIVVFCAAMFFFLVGPVELARRIRLQLDPTSKRRVYRLDHLKVQTDIPARLDRLPWGAFHTLVAAALGITWILNGLEITLASNLQDAILNSPILKLSSDTQLGIASSAYLAGTVLGALFFGWLTDRLGRKRLFFVTLLIYLLFTGLTGLSWNFESLTVFRFLTGMGIGGEYAAINSTIQELIPAKFRGRTDLLVSGTFWIGAAIAAIGSTVLLDGTIVDPELGWRAAFLIGAALALVVLRIRREIPESPRWLMTHNRVEEAEAIVAGIEERFRGQLDTGERLPTVHLIGRTSTPIVEVVKTIFQVYPGRALVCFSLMAAQALLYNAIFFSHPLALPRFFDVPLRSVGWYFLPFAVGNFLGPLLLGPLFDRVGRKSMISSTYLLSGILIAISAYVFNNTAGSALTISLAWMITFFFASAAASAAYLTAGELFPLEIRAIAIAFFFAIGTGLGGVVGPWVFTLLMGSRANLTTGYIVLSIAMISAALVELRWGIDAERKPLEAVAPPLTFTT